MYAHACRQTHILSVFNMYQYAKLIIYIYIYIYTCHIRMSPFHKPIPHQSPRSCVMSRQICQGAVADDGNAETQQQQAAIDRMPDIFEDASCLQLRPRRAVLSTDPSPLTSWGTSWAFLSVLQYDCNEK